MLTSPPGNRYDVMRELGKGGVSVVYLAHDRVLDRHVALKQIVLTSVGPDSVARLLRGLRAAATLNHPNIVAVHETFGTDDEAYVVSEYLEHGPLRPWIGRLTLPQIAGVLEDILAALQHAHSMAVVHLDLKPENVLVATDGRVKVSDFSIANAYRNAQAARPTKTGVIAGTPTYMAPEQAMGREIGPSSDLYAVGVVGYELTLGRTPFHDAESPVAILLSQVNEPPPAPQSIDPDIDPELATWIERLLQKNPEARPASAQEAWDDLEEIVIRLCGPRWRRDASLLSPEISPRSPAFEAPVAEAPSEAPPSLAAEGQDLGALLRDAALAGVVPADRFAAPREAPAPAPAPVAAAAPEPEATPLDEVHAEPPAAGGPHPSLVARILLPLIVLGALAAAAKWLFGLFADFEVTRAGASDFVQCTVFAPPSATPDSQILVQVFAHLPEEAEDAHSIAGELDTEARKRAFHSLASPVRAGSRLGFELQIPGLQVDDPIASLVWRRRTEAVQFGVGIPAETPTGTVIGTVTVSLDSVPVGHVKFKLAIESEAATLPSEPQGETARRYRFAFISYSSKDRAEVLRRVQLLSVVGIKYFQDVLSLEPGDRWQKRIDLGIDECDLFLLFWSSDAKRSDAVRQEVRHVLARKGGDDLSPPEIRPVVLEGPPVVEPWEELAHLHFNDSLLYFIRPQGRTNECPACGHPNEEAADFCSNCGAYLAWEHAPGD